MKLSLKSFVPDYGTRPLLSSAYTAMMLIVCACAAPSHAQQSYTDTDTSVLQPPLQQAYPQPQVQAVFTPIRPIGSLQDGLSQWQNLRSGRGRSFMGLSSFLLAHPGWPGEADLRDAAERAIVPEQEDSAQVVSFFQRFPAKTATAQLRYAEALYSLGQRALANNAAHIAWTGGGLTTDDESRFMIRFASILSQPEQDVRMDHLLWGRVTNAAMRQLSRTSPAYNGVFAARLAWLTHAPDAESKGAEYISAAANDAGITADRAAYLNATGQSYAARIWLGRPHHFSVAPFSPLNWMTLLLDTARRASDEHDYSNAFAVARQVGDAYPAGTHIRTQSFDERDAYTSLVWMAGDVALNKLGRASEAIQYFQLYAEAARTANGQAKGLYWAARAAEVARQNEAANDFYGQAAVYFESFYGQLASEKLGRPIRLGDAPAVRVDQRTRTAYLNSELALAALTLGREGQRNDQSLFMRTLANQAQNDSDLALATELGRAMNRMDMGVWASRITRGSGGTDFIRAAFPQIPNVQGNPQDWTMIHAISRQETNFDTGAISRTNARGLMQLEPSTARQLASKNGLPYDYGALISNPAYNMQLGALVYRSYLARFNGCIVCAVAAYNAGPGRVNQWSVENGDPRNVTVDIVKWIEAIPFTETRGYVQNVLQNAVVYDMLSPNGSRQNMRPLSVYLGR